MFTVIKYLPNQQQTLLGKFSEHTDADLFAAAKYNWDEALKSVKAIYKVADAEDDKVLSYQVAASKPGQARESLASFKERADAKLFMQARIEDDENCQHVKTTYVIIEDNQVIESQTSEVGQQNQLTQRFSPTPMPKSPRPPGTPPIVWDDDNDDD